MKITAEQGKALDWYAKHKGYQFMLSVFPEVRFRNRATGEVVPPIDLMYIVTEYQQAVQEDRKMAAYEKKRQEQEAQRSIRRYG